MQKQAHRHTLYGNEKEAAPSVESLYLRIALHDDAEAFEQLFYDYFPPLCVFANRYLDDKEVCEDIVQDTFLKIWNNRKEQEVTTSVRNFLLTSVKNNCLNYLKRKDLEETYVRRRTEQVADGFFVSHDDLYTTRELEQLIETALGKLPENVCEVFEMNRFEGITYARIAEVRRISVKTVEAYMSKALKLLREELADYLPFLFLFLW